MLAINPCTRSLSPILYSEVNSAANFLPVSTQNVFTFLVVFSRNDSADRFLLWWLFLHRRLRSRQRGSRPKYSSDFATLWLYPFQKVLFVFIRTTRKVFQLSLASLSASIQSVNSNYFPSFVALKQCVTASACLSLVSVKTPVSNFDYVTDSTPVFLDVK